MSRLAAVLLAISGAWMLMATGAAIASPDQDKVWVRVDTDAAVTEVWRGDRRLMRLDDVAFGRGGISDVHFRGDQTTPRGKFRITRFNRESRFHIFIGINYPTLAHLDDARQRGAMTEAEYSDALQIGHEYGEFPQDGTLGGHIGFHGIGNGNPAIHRDFHWTEGCIALTNEQIETLHSVVKIGTPVVIE